MNSIKVEYSLRHEAEALYFNSHEIYAGFYAKYGWYVLPPESEYSLDKPVVLIDRINYRNIFAGHPTILKDDFQDEIPEEKYVKRIEEELISKGLFAEIPEGEMREYHKRYSDILEKAIEKTKTCLPQMAGKDFDITVILSKYGTLGSFNIANLRGKKVKIKVRVRLDQPIEIVQELFISSITNSLIKSDNLKWREMEAISDFITKHVLGYKDHIGTLSMTKEPDYKLLQASNKFLKEVGLPTGEILKYNPNNNKITQNGSDIGEQLSPYEFRLLRILLENINKTVTFEQIAEEVYKTNVDIKFSLWGITKTIQRLRDKLDDIGVARNSIVNVKGEGFKLVL